MKKVLLFALCIAIPMAGFAQKKAKKGKNVEEVVTPVVEALDDEECLMLLSLSHESVKAEQYDDAYENWSKLYQSRPDFNKTIFTDGNKILEYKWNNAQTPEEKNQWREMIMKLHDERINFFDDPKYPDAYVLGLKGLDYLTYYPEDELGLKAYECLKQSVEGMGENAQITVLRKLVEVSYNIYKSNPDQYGDQFLADYQKVAGLMDAIVAKGGKHSAAANEQKAYVDRLYAASGAADCGQMDQMYASVVAESTGDLDKLSSIMKLYRRLGCTESDVYFAAAESAHKLQPTSESAAGCGQMSIKKGDFEGALTYYKQALELATENEDKADYLYRIANIYVSLGNYQQGVSYAEQALAIEPEDGRCYLLIGLCYASAKIYDDPILARSVYWVACDMFNKAKAVDTSCASDANKLIATYAQYFPSKEDVFFHRELNEGQSFRVGGWVNKTTTCRAKKE